MSFVCMYTHFFEMLAFFKSYLIKLQVKQDFENVAADLVEHKRALSEFEQKEKEMASLIQDLTSIVKEQKTKIAELTKSNEEATANLKVFVSKHLNMYICFFG